jgi:hypothetical protein
MSTYTLTIGPHGRILRNGWGGIPGHYGEPTTAECIALAHVKARARMGRFVAWLRDDAGQRFVARPSQVAPYMSPEHYIRAALNERWFWPLLMMGGQWCNRYACKRNAADVLLASPEWTSLPWQQDPSEVTL